MGRGFPSMTALLGLLAVAGYQNRDKIAEMLGGLGQSTPAGTGQSGTTGTGQSGISGLLGQLGRSLGSASAGGILNGGLGELLDRFTRSGQGETAALLTHQIASRHRDVIEAEPRQEVRAMSDRINRILEDKAGCGMLDGDGLRCAYHGWKYEKDGSCVDTPAEPDGSKLKARIKLAGYPVQEMAGLLWGYLGAARFTIAFGSTPVSAP